MLKGYVQATSENAINGRKCYIKSTGTRPDIHNLVPNTFGTIIDDCEQMGEGRVVNVEGKWVHSWELNDFEPLDQFVYIDNLLVKVGK